MLVIYSPTFTFSFISSTLNCHHHAHHLTIIVTVLYLLLIIQCTSVYSMGTLLHAGPSCIIKPYRKYTTKGENSFIADSPVKHRGICYSTLLCKQKGGVAIGKCGLGNSCCVFPQTCNSILVRNSTYFTSPGYPSLVNKTEKPPDNKSEHLLPSEQETEEMEDLFNVNYQNRHQPNNNKNLCSLTIHRMPGIHHICRIRLDFIEYEIENHQTDSPQSAFLDPTVSTDDYGCTNNDDHHSGKLDWITIQAMHEEQANIVEPICPTLKLGQHVIVDVRKHIGPFLLTVHSGSLTGRRRWNILINQIECSRTQYRAPIANSIDT